MAQRIQVILEDDILRDGQPADETVLFGVDGVNYEIDLNATHAAQLRDALAPYVHNGRRTGGRKSSGRGVRPGSGSDLNAVRTWARSNGYPVADRGRVSANILAAYDRANG